MTFISVIKGEIEHGEQIRKKTNTPDAVWLGKLRKRGIHFHIPSGVCTVDGPGVARFRLERAACLMCAQRWLSVSAPCVCVSQGSGGSADLHTVRKLKGAF